jgi:hypothetical protein
MELDRRSQITAEVGDGRYCLVLMGSERACRERSRPHQPQRQSVLFLPDRGDAKDYRIRVLYTISNLYPIHSGFYCYCISRFTSRFYIFIYASLFSCPYSHPPIPSWPQCVDRSSALRWLSNKSGSFQRLGKAVNALSKLTR